MAETKRSLQVGKAEFDRQYEKAVREGRRRDATEPRAREARYDAKADLVVVDLTNGARFMFPPRLAQGLAGASGAALTDIEITPGGRGIRWPSLDADYSVPQLMAGIFGTKRWMSELARMAGSTSTEAKARAARENGKKGGRPRRVPAA